MMSVTLGGNVALTSPEDILIRLNQLLDRYLTATGEERQRMTVEYIDLKDALEEARRGGGYVTVPGSASD